MSAKATTSVLWGAPTKTISRGVHRISGFLKCSPLDWDDSSESVVLSNDTNRYAGWYLNVGVSVAYELFLATRLVQCNLGHISATPAEAAVLKFWTGVYMFQIVCQVALVLHAHEIPGFLRRASEWFRRVEEYYREHPNSAVEAMLTPSLDKNLFSMFCSDVAWPVLWLIPCVLYPGQLIYPTSVMENPEDAGLLIRSAGVALYAYVIVMWYCSIYVWFTTFVPVTINLPIVLQALKEHQQHMKRSDLHWNVQEWDSVLRLYREAQILVAEFSDVCCSVFIPGMKWTITLSITYCMCGALMLPDWPPRALLAAFFVIVVPTMDMIFTYLGQFWTQSTSFLELGKRCLKDELSRKTFRSMAPIKAVMGGMYFIDDLSALTMLNFTVTTSISIIVASKS